MFSTIARLGALFAVTGLLLLQNGCASPKDIVRPEKIVSKRKVIHDEETYAELARLWRTYYDAFPSEDAYANWMYAARYAGDKDYEKLLAKGLKKYPANPTLLYLTGMLHSGGGDPLDQQKMERAAELDPAYDDPWYGLVTIYMAQGNDEKLDLALRKLLEGGAVAEEVLDYNYNVLSGLDSNAILITNGDNDTFPIWILQRTLKYRTDVVLANRSLLNTEWYAGYLMERGLVKFIAQDELKALRERGTQRLKAGGPLPVGGLVADSLIVMIAESARRAGRPMYFALTLYDSDVLAPLKEEGELLGLAIRVTPSATAYAADLTKAAHNWLDEFRTGGLDSWRIRYAQHSDAGRWLVSNYAFAMISTLDTLKANAPKLRGDLFDWYLKHIAATLPEQHRDKVEQVWCRQNDLPQIQEWCRKAGREK